MKLVNITAVAIALFTLSLTNAHAGDRQVGGLILGGGTGAIVGQAIGQNTESTIIGATVGGVLGLIVGSELERHHGSVHHDTVVVAHSRKYHHRPRPVFKHKYRYNHRPVFKHNYRYNHRPVYKDHYRDSPRYRHDRKYCGKGGRSFACGKSPRHHYKKYRHFKHNDRYYR